jgi:outer membrane autotransporter protein
MKKLFAALLLSAMIVPLFTANGFAAVQSVAGVTVALDATTGQLDGVAFTGAGTVTVTDGQPLNSNANPTGVSTTVDNQGNLIFAGSSVVTGAVGTAPLSLNTITASGGAGKTVSFLGNVFADTNAILNGTGTLAFGGNYTGTTLYNAGATGTITLAAAKTMTGAINNSVTNQGALTLGAGSSVVGAVGSAGAGLNVIDLSGAASSITGATKATTINLSGAGSSITGSATATTINMSSTTNSINGAVTATNLNLTGGNASIVGATAVTNYALNGNTLAINGAVTVPAIGNLALTATSASSFGKITSTGLATVTAGATATVNVTGFVANGTQLVIVDGTGGASVAPNLVVTSTSPNIGFTSNTGAASDWTVTASRINATTSPTASAVTTSINGTTPTGDLMTAVSALDALSSAEAVNDAVVQLDPTNNGATTQAVFGTANETVGALTTHLGESGGNTGRESGVSTGDFWLDNGIWAKFFGNSTEQDRHKGVNGYDSTTWGLLGGIDGVVANDVRLGFAGGYAGTNVDNKGESGGTDVDSYIGTIYMSYDDPSPWYGDMGFNFTWNSFDNTRRIVFPGLDRTATSSPDGQTYTGFGDVGYVIPVNERWNVTPMAGLTYSHIEIGKYTESGADALNLNVAGQNYDQLLSSLGVKLDAEYRTKSGGRWVPEVHARWLYDFIGDEVATTASFTGGGSSFSTSGLEPVQSTYNLGTGVTFYSKGNISVTGTYDYRVGTDYSAHTGLATVRYTF